MISIYHLYDACGRSAFLRFFHLEEEKNSFVLICYYFGLFSMKLFFRFFEFFFFFLKVINHFYGNDIFFFFISVSVRGWCVIRFHHEILISNCLYKILIITSLLPTCFLSNLLPVAKIVSVLFINCSSLWFASAFMLGVKGFNEFIVTGWKVAKYGVFSGPYFSV